MSNKAIAEEQKASTIGQWEDESVVKITELNYDCLLEVFKNFLIIDLIVMANMHPHFVDAARTIFRRKYTDSYTDTNEFTKKQSISVSSQNDHETLRYFAVQRHKESTRWSRIRSFQRLAA